MKVTNFNRSHGGSCTLSEISSIQGNTAENIIKEAALAYEQYKCMVFLYTTTNNNVIGDELRNLIAEKNLGRVVKQKPYINTRYASGTKVTLWLWFVGHEGIAGYIETLQKQEVTKN